LGAAGEVLSIDEDQKRDLVGDLTNVALSASVAPHMLWQVSQVLPEIEHFFPERREAVVKKLSAFKRTMNEADRDQVMDADARPPIFQSLDHEEILAAVTQKQVDQLQKLLPRIQRKEDRAWAMAELALMLHEKGEKEDVSSMLDEAATLLKPDLKDDKQTKALLTLLYAFAIVDPPKAFTLAERSVDRANRQISLLLLLDKVVKSGAVKKNEILLEQPNLMPLDFIVFKYGKGVAALAKADFNRTKALAERFERNELRLMAQLFVLRGLLEPNPPSPLDALLL
jgi:hypothetical protein